VIQYRIHFYKSIQYFYNKNLWKGKYNCPGDFFILHTAIEKLWMFIFCGYLYCTIQDFKCYHIANSDDYQFDIIAACF